MFDVEYDKFLDGENTGMVFEQLKDRPVNIVSLLIHKDSIDCSYEENEYSMTITGFIGVLTWYLITLLKTM